MNRQEVVQSALEGAAYTSAFGFGIRAMVHYAPETSKDVLGFMLSDETIARIVSEDIVHLGWLINTSLVGAVLNLTFDYLRPKSSN